MANDVINGREYQRTIIRRNILILNCYYPPPFEAEEAVPSVHPSVSLVLRPFPPHPLLSQFFGFAELRCCCDLNNNEFMANGRESFPTDQPTDRPKRGAEETSLEGLTRHSFEWCREIFIKPATEPKEWRQRELVEVQVWINSNWVAGELSSRNGRPSFARIYRC